MRRLRAPLARFAAAADQFLDSQSGLTLSRPRRDVLRVHELCADAGAAPAAGAPAPPLSREVALHVALALPPAAAAAARGGALFARVGSSGDVGALRRAAGAGARVGAAISVPPRAAPAAARAAAELVRAAAGEAGAGAPLRARAVVLSAFALEPDALEDLVARLADAGAAEVTLAAGDGARAAPPVDEEAVREAVERAFALDVAGDALLERLGVRGSLAACAAALRAGATRLEAHARGGLGAAATADVLDLAREHGREVVA